MEFKTEDDLWDIMYLLIDECRETNKRSVKQFDVVNSVVAQIPFFACPNNFISKEHQEDIKRYLYCLDNNVKPYEGCYDQQPYIWVEKFFIIKTALAKKERAMQEQSMKEKN